MKKTILLILLLAVLIGVLIYTILNQKEPAPVTVDLPPQPPAAIEPSRKAIVHYPVPDPLPGPEEKDAGQEPPQEPEPPALPATLPPVGQSDPTVRQILKDHFEPTSLFNLLKLDSFIPKLVVTIDSLPEKRLPKRHLPVERPDGRFLVFGPPEAPQTSKENHKRYVQHVQLLEALDPEKVVTIYVHLYPLFQSAYRQLGYPNAYFNDRLVFVIDHLLETPDQPEPILLEQPSVLYQFADPELENLSAGQKILIRIGPENRHRVKQVLRKYRRLLVNLQPES